MDETFTARNGVKIRPGIIAGIHLACAGGGDAHNLASGETEALRDFFQHERDKELGRWRDPLEPHYVCYPVDGGVSVRGVDERNGTTSWINRRVEATDTGVHGAAFRFFEARPERKPWEDAKAGEAWVIQVPAGPVVAYRRFDGHFYDYEGNRLHLDRTDSARKIWPAS